MERSGGVGCGCTLWDRLDYTPPQKNNLHMGKAAVLAFTVAISNGLLAISSAHNWRPAGLIIVLGGLRQCYQVHDRGQTASLLYSVHGHAHLSAL